MHNVMTESHLEFISIVSFELANCRAIFQHIHIVFLTAKT